VAGEDHLARLCVEFGKIARRRAQQNIALLDLCEAEIVQDLGDREQVDLELQGACDVGQVRLAVIGWRARLDRRDDQLSAGEVDTIELTLIGEPCHLLDFAVEARPAVGEIAFTSVSIATGNGPSALSSAKVGSGIR
jgi:hypothetical protein